MIKDWRLKLARWMIRHRSRPVRFVSALPMWLVFWCIPIAGIIFLAFGYAILLVLPVLVVGRYFVARRTADVVLAKIGDILRLNHPLAQTLQRMGEFEPGLIGVRLITIGELLSEGMPVAESLRLALPEIDAGRLGTIATAESQDMLIEEFSHHESWRQTWDIFTELDTAQLVYFALLALAVPMTAYLISRFVLPRFMRWHIVAAFYPHSIRTNGLVATTLFITVIFIPVMIGGALLRRLVVPFFRRAEWFLFCGDALTWRLPVWGRLVQARSWAAATSVLAAGIERGVPLPQNCRLAAEAARNRVARRRLRFWGQLAEGGGEAAAAARQAHLPRRIRTVMTMPGDMLGAGLNTLTEAYRRDYQRTMNWVRAAGIPVTVLFFGAAILGVILMVYWPYAELLGALARSAQ
jgi:type II secretory pathway component PulF